jgi:integrase
MKLFLKTLPDRALFIVDLKYYHIENYLDELQRRNYKVATINSYLRIIKVFCKWLAKRYKVLDPTQALANLKPRRSDRRFLSREEYIRLLTVCDERIAPWIKFLAATGVRASVFCSLRWKMYNPDDKTLHIPAGIAKGYRTRTIGLNKTARAVLNNIRKHRSSLPGDLIFTVKNGRPLNRKLLHKKVSEGFKHLGLSGGPHLLRHYCATELLRAGVPIIKVSKFLGHADIATTQRHYEHLVVSDFAHIAEALDV